jgi:outer membrane immunogenic protein
VSLDTDQVTFKMNVLLNNFFCGRDSAVAGSQPVSGLGGKETVSSKDKDKIVQLTPAEPFNWTGLYVGGHIGAIWNDFDFGSYDTDVDASQQFFSSGPLAATSTQGTISGPGVSLPFDVVSFRTPSPSSNSLDSNSDWGLIGGGQAGYNYQWHNWVFGVEGDFSGSSTSGWEKFSQTSEAFIFDEPFLAVTTLNTMRKVETSWSASLRGRIGYAHGPLMVYGTGGATWTDVQVWNTDTASTDFLLFGDTFEFSAFDKNTNKDEKVVMGWTAGGGVEWALTRMVSMGLEYRHNWYGSDSYGFDAHQGPIFPGSTSVNLDGDQVTFRVNFLLGHIHGP